MTAYTQDFYTQGNFAGSKQSLTPEGYLLIRDVPIARTGEMVYGPGQTPLAVGRDGLVRVSREETEVFRADTLLSMEGKDVVDEHPPEMVNPSNWKRYSIGHMQNVRRGQGEHVNHLVADLLIKDADAIRAVQAGKREVSCGYRAEYEQTADGYGRQFNIVGNHVALVRRGRCGPSCAIGDSDMTTKTYREKLLGLFGAKDRAELDSMLDGAAPLDGEPTGPAIHVHNHMVRDGVVEHKEGQASKTGDAAPAWFKDFETKLETRFAAYDAKFKALDEDEEDDEKKKKKDSEDAEETKEELKKEAKPGTEDQAAVAKDSRFLDAAFQDTRALAEIIAPGMAMPTFDSAIAPRATLDSICQLRRQAIDYAYGQGDTRVLITSLLGGKQLNTGSMTCDELRTMFRAVGVHRRHANNFVAPGGTVNVAKKSVVKTPADLNALFKKKYEPAA